MSFQDLNEFKIGGGKINYNKNTTKFENIKKEQNLPGTKTLKKLEEDEIYVLPKISLNDSKSIEQKRNKCNLSQKDLASMLNIPISVIKNIESGKENNNKGLINKIINFLNKRNNL